MKKLSIIVPVYNVESYLPRCLDSLFSPEHRNEYEIIAVNDGSTDASGEILDDYQRRWPELLRVVTTENGGLGHARNEGIPLAAGENILFVDSDDWLSEGAMDQIFAVLEKSFDIAVFDFVHVDEEGREMRRFSGCERDGAFTLKEYPEFLFSPLNAWNKIWKTRLFTESGIRFPDRLWYEDVATTPKLYLRAGTILHVPSVWYCYLQRSGSITRALSPERNREVLTVMAMYLEDFEQQGRFEEFREQLEYMAFYHEFLTSVTRVNLLDPHSDIQDALREDYLRRFPHFRKNRYFRAAPAKYRLLADLIEKRRWQAVHLLMTANNIVKGR